MLLVLIFLFFLISLCASSVDQAWAKSLQEPLKIGSFGRKDHKARLSRDARTALYAYVSTTSPQVFSPQNRKLNSIFNSPLQGKPARAIENYRSQAEEIVAQNRRCPIQNSDLSSQTKRKESPSKKKSLFIFVSFSMPLETLQALADEAHSHGGQLVFQGLVEGSFQKTAQKFQQLKRQVLLDPTLFREHNVKTVPTFLQCQGKICDRLSGNVTLTYALKQFGNHQGESR